MRNVKLTPKQSVKKCIPNAVLLRDMRSDLKEYSTDWANSNCYTVGYFNNQKQSKNKVIKTTFVDLINDSNFVFLAPWCSSPKEAWLNAWRLLQQHMILTLEK